MKMFFFTYLYHYVIMFLSSYHHVFVIFKKTFHFLQWFFFGIFLKYIFKRNILSHIVKICNFHSGNALFHSVSMLSILADDMAVGRCLDFGAFIFPDIGATFSENPEFPNLRLNAFPSLKWTFYFLFHIAPRRISQISAKIARVAVSFLAHACNPSKWREKRSTKNGKRLLDFSCRQ